LNFQAEELRQIEELSLVTADHSEIEVRAANILFSTSSGDKEKLMLFNHAFDSANLVWNLNKETFD